MHLINRYPLSAKMELNQKGFSLVELMVGLVIGLLATLVIMQTFSLFEGQKRSTSGTADAQTSGSVALYSLQRDLQLAGFGLPLYDNANMPLNCTTTTFDDDNNAATPKISMVPIEITEGVASTDSDIVAVRYGDSQSGGIPVPVLSVAGSVVSVDTSMACSSDDVVYAVTPPTVCTVTRVTAIPSDTQVTLKSVAGIIVAPPPPAPTDAATRFACLGTWSEVIYRVNATNQLERNVNNPAVPTPMMDGIVNMQAQYGVSANTKSNLITQWVDATGAWSSAVITPANRNRIKAVRIAVIARNGLLEKEVVSTACSSELAANPTGLCAWDATSADPATASPAPVVDLSNTDSWDHYRYKVYETIIPLRNIIWTRERL